MPPPAGNSGSAGGSPRETSPGKPLPVGKPLPSAQSQNASTASAPHVASASTPNVATASGPARAAEGPASDPKVQAFVAAARPIIDRAGGLQPALAELRTLSAEMGLQPAQLRAVETLLSPPLIGQSKPGYTIARRAESPSSAAQEGIVREKDARQKESGQNDAGQEIVWIDQTPSTPPPIVPPVSMKPANSADRVAWFQERALSIIAENRGFGPKTQMMLAQAATDLGLLPIELEIAMHSLREPSQIPASPVASPLASGAPSASDSAATADQSASVESTAKETEPPKPAVAFQMAAAAELANFVAGKLGRKERRAIINRGVAEFRLCEPFARRLVDQAATARGLAIEEKREGGQASGIGKKLAPVAAAQLSEKAEAFLSKARQILAEHRGLNAKSRVFLNAAAANLALPSEEIEPLIARLQQSHEKKTESEDDPLYREQLDAFRQWLDVKLARLEPKLVTASIQRRYITAAEDQHGITGEQGRAILTDLAAARGLLFISAEQAVKHLSDRVYETLLSDAPYDSEARYRLVAEAEQWGLDAEEAEELVDQQIAQHKASARRRRKLTRRLIGAAVGVIAIVAAGLIVAVAATRSRQASEVASSDDGAAGSGETAADRRGRSSSAEVSGDGEGPSATAGAEDKTWRDVDLIVAMAAATSAAPDFEPLLAKTRSSSADERLTAYRQIIDRAAETAVSDGPVSTARAEARRSVLEEIIAGCYALDPSEACAAAIAEAIVQRIPTESTPLPTEAVAIRQAFWASSTAAAAIKRTNNPAERADALSRSVSRAVGLSIDPGLGPIELARFIQEAVAATLYRKLAAGYTVDPASVKRLEPVLAAESLLRFERETLARYQADYLAAVIPSLGADWKDFQVSMSRCADARDPLVVLKLADACEKASNPELKEWLLIELLMRVEHFQAVASPEEALAIVRKKLGASDRAAPIAEADRVLAFSSSAQTALAAKPAATSSPSEQLARVVQLAHLNSLGCALARQDAGRATFDELMRVGPPKLRSGGSLASERKDPAGSFEEDADMSGESPPRSPGDSGFSDRLKDLGIGSPLRFMAAGDVGEDEEDEEDEMESEESPLRSSRASDAPKLNPEMRRYYIQELLTAIDPRSSSSNRTRALPRVLPSVSNRLDDLDLRTARTAAEYLCLRKPDAEHEAVLGVIDSFAKWKTVKLVLADNIEAIRLAEDQLLPILSGITGREIEAGVSARKQAREALLQSVIDDLSGESEARAKAAPAPAFEEAREALLGLYVEQAKVSGVASGDYLAATSTAQILKLLIQSQAGVTAGPGRSADAAMLSRLREETAAIEYLAADDLSRTILLQRLWLRVCVAELAGKQGVKAAEADRIVSALAESDRSSTAPLSQLIEGETALLKVWLLWSRPKA